MNKLYLPVFPEESGVTGFFSTAAGCCVKSPYYNEEVLRQNGLENACLVWPQQVHGNHVAVILKKTCADENALCVQALTDDSGRAFSYEKEQEKIGLRVPETDAVITNVPGVLLVTVHADCIPVCLYDPVAQAIGVIHAGWRGTAKRIAAAAVEKMRDVYGSRPEDILAWIGPGISLCCFETGEEVPEAFRETCPWIDEYVSRGSDKPHLDLKGINERQLGEAGVTSVVIDTSCTCCDDSFCSYRRQQGTDLRMGAGLCLVEKSRG